MNTIDIASMQIAIEKLKQDAREMIDALDSLTGVPHNTPEYWKAFKKACFIIAKAKGEL